MNAPDLTFSAFGGISGRGAENTEHRLANRKVQPFPQPSSEPGLGRECAEYKTLRGNRRAGVFPVFSSRQPAPSAGDLL